MANNIILCGFMGCGKTTLGERLAKHFCIELVDTDTEIVKRENRTIANIFETDGEQYFRNLETELIKELSLKENLIISLGGGLAANEVNHPYLKTAGKVILLDCGIDETLKRISGDNTRPLTKGGREDIINRYNTRKPIYSKVADAVIDTSKDIESVVLEAISIVENIL